MTTEEKLQHFLDFCMEDARSQSEKMLDEYKKALEDTFSEHQKSAIQRAEHHIELEKKLIEKETNKKLSLEQINIRRTLGRKQDELKEILFKELSERLNQYMETEEYTKFLNDQVKNAIKLANKEFITIYIDPMDKDKLKEFNIPQSTEILISAYSFMGGIRAVIPSKHILIDNSFQTRLSEAKHDFHFNLKDIMGGEIHES